ncbi:MAG: hypothetical protein IKT29_04110 [Flavobacteriales bacterium]|nr:hypothetical protein [Flavobacteriales bacterium]
MNRNNLRLFIAVFSLVVIVIGIISGRLHQSFESTPGSTAFIVVVLLAYSAFTLRTAVKNRHKK